MVRSMAMSPQASRTIAKAKTPRGRWALSITAPRTGPPTAAAPVSEATTYEPLAALPIADIATIRVAGPVDSVAERASVASVR